MEENLYEMTINIELRQKHGPYGGLSIREVITVNANGFIEIAGILSKFHDLAEKIKQDR